MPNYNPALTKALYQGQSMTLADSTLVTPFTSQAIAVASDPDGAPVLTFTNPSTEVAPIYYAATDVDANYLPYAQVAAGAAQSFTVGTGFYRLALAAAPSAAITVSR